MVRRINAPSSSWLLLTVLCLAFGAMVAQAQSPESAQQRSSGGSTFIVAPTVHLPAAATSVASGDLNGDGKLDLVFTTRGSASITVLLGNGRGGFAAGVEYAAGKEPGHVLLADLSGAGKLDVVVSDGATGSIQVLRGSGDGTFAKPVAFRGIANPVALTVGNFGGKGKIDLAVASATGIAVLLNDGAGHLSPASTIPVTRALVALAAADLKADGRDDLVAANADGTITVLEGNASGGFHARNAVKVAAGALSAIAAADFNHDGRADLALAQANTGKLTVLLGRGDATFESGVNYTVGNNPAFILAADLKGDGHIDLVTANAAANTFSVLAGKGDGAFRPAVDFAAGKAPLAIAAGNFYGAGRVDLAIVNGGDATVSLPQGHGDGAFHAAASYRTGLEQKSIASGDLAGNGLADLVVTNFCGEDSACKHAGTATVMLAAKNGAYRQGASYNLGSGPVAVALADIFGHKTLDLVAASRNDKTLLVLPGKGNGTFGEPVSYTLTANPRAIYVGDFNGDGHADLAIAGDCGKKQCTDNGTVEVWLRGAGGRLTYSSSYTVGFSPVAIAGGDLRSTGHIDLVIANACGNDSSCKSHGTATVLRGHGNGRFLDGGEVDLGASPSAVAIGNLTGRGLDLAVAERGSNRVDVLRGDGKGGFGEPASYRVGVQPAALAIADFNGDGHPDIAVANFKDSTVSLLRGTPNGTLSAAVHYPVGTGPEALAAVSGVRSGSSALVTANGNSGASPMGADITVLRDAAAATDIAMAAPTPNPSTVNDAVTLQATVTPHTGGGNVNVGTVEFDQSTDGGTTFTPISDCASVNVNGTGVANCTTHRLHAPVSPATMTVLEASYTGDGATWADSGPSSTVTQTVNTEATTTTATASATPTVDKALIITATVNATGAVVPMTGNVTFTGTVPGCTSFTTAVAFSAGKGTAQCTASATIDTSGNPYNVTAAYSADPNYADSTSTALGVTMALQTTTTKMTSTAASAKVDEPPTITATVAPPTGTTASVTIGGSVTFSGTVPGCGAPASVVVPVVFSSGNNNATATCVPTASSMIVGSYSVTGAYSGDANYKNSTSTAFSQNVIKENTASVVTSSANPADINSPPTLTATISPGNGDSASVAIGGTVAFKDNGTTITGCSAQTVTFDTTGLVGVATCTPGSASLTVGSNPITAVYSGDSNYSGSTSPSFAQTINAAGTSTVVTSNANPSAVDQPLTYTATITPPAGSTVTMHGTVTFTNNSAPIPGCTTAASVTFSGGVGTATCSPTLVSLVANTYSITGAYSGDPNYSGSTSAVFSQVVNQASTQVGVTPGTSSSSVDGSLTFTATVTPVSGTGAVSFAGGTMAFFADASAIGGCTAKAVTFNSGPGTGTASCSTTLLTAGSHSITATYSGNTNYLASPISAGATATVSQGGSTTAVAALPTSSTVDQAVTITATISPTTSVTPANTVPFLNTGTVAFLDGATGITGCGAVPVTYNAGTGTASAACPFSGLTAAGSPHSLKATFSGDTDYNTSTSAGQNFTVVKSGTVTSLISSSNPAPATSSVTFTATVAPPSGVTATVPISGSVEFKSDGTDIASCSAQPISGTGPYVASCTTATLAASPTAYSITAIYHGDGNYGTSTSTALLESVGKTSAITALTSNPAVSPSNVNQSVTFTESVTVTSGATPTGTVTFTNNGNSITDNSGHVVCANVALPTTGPNTGMASCATTLLSAGPHTIQATYSGDTNYAITTNSAIWNVNAINSTIAAAASSGAPPAPIVTNQAVTLTATVTPAPSAARVPLTGTVTFTENGAALSGCVPSFNASTGIATCSDTSLLPGTHSIVANYQGDLSYNASSSTALSQVVNAATVIIALNSSTNPSAVNQNVTFTATITAPAGPTALSGKVTFADNGANISTCASVPVTVVANIGIATCSIATLTQGNHNITGTYGQDTNFATATSSALPQTVEAAFTTTALTSSVSTTTVDSPVTLTANVTSAKGSSALTGNVAFTSNGTPIAGCSAVVVNNAGVAACTTSALLAGSDGITATYGHDNSFTGSSANLAVLVKPAATSLALATSLSPSVVNNPKNINDTVTFTATLTSAAFTTPGQAAVPLTGSVSFLDNDVPITGCDAVVVVAAGTATCTTNTLSAGSDNIHAIYQFDNNYLASNISITQLVSDFSLGVFTTPPVTVTQGFTTANDPIQTKIITLAPTSTQNYTGNLNLTCTVVASSAPSGAVAPLCGLATTTLPVVGGAIQQSVGIIVDATNATGGLYKMMVTGTDTSNGLQRASTPLLVTVSATNSLTVISGSTTNNSQKVRFEIPAGVSIAGIQCLSVSGPTLPQAKKPADLNMSCAIDPSTIPSSASPQSVDVKVTVFTGKNTTAAVENHSTILTAGLSAAAGLMTIPLFLLIGLVRRRRLVLDKAGILRMLAVAAVVVGGLQSIGCGGSFKRITVSSGGATPPGSYDLLIQGAGSDKNAYQAVLKVNVTLQ